jgi:hypothetical protein
VPKEPLIASPADDDGTGDTDTVFACTTGDPFITYALLTDIQPGDLLRVSGTVVQPETPGGAAQLTVDALQTLAAASLPVLNEMVLDRYGLYLCVFDVDRDQVPVFTEDGAWVGEAASPDVVGDLIDAFENGGESF